jgi:hypothetical protein
MTVVVHRHDLIQIMKKDKPMNLPFAHLPCQTITINHRAMLMVNIPMPTGKSDKGKKSVMLKTTAKTNCNQRTLFFMSI